MGRHGRLQTVNAGNPPRSGAIPTGRSPTSSFYNQGAVQARRSRTEPKTGTIARLNILGQTL